VTGKTIKFDLTAAADAATVVAASARTRTLRTINAALRDPDG
jgi:hypothetical protein